MLLKIFSVLFLLGAIVCAVLAYMLGGPLWDDDFEFNRMMHYGSIYLLATLACLLLGFALMFHKKKPATP